MALATLALITGGAEAYETYSVARDATNCRACHGDYRASPYTSLKPGEGAWPGNLHDGHRDDMLAGNCDACRDVPVDGFWSISVYNAEGYFLENEHGSYSLNNVTAKSNEDGSYTIHFGGDPKADNYLYIMPGWNYTLRLYRPRSTVLDGSWKIPEPQPMD